MRRVLLAIVLVMACRRDRAADTPRGTRPGNGSDRARPGQSVRISDDELAAYTRWQRDSMDLFLRHRAEIDAVASDDPSRPFEDINAVMPRIQALTARHAPAMQALLDRVPLKDRKAELAAEGTGGIFHYERRGTGFELVVARDEIRIRAARRRFGAEAVDDILKREPLIMAALQRP